MSLTQKDLDDLNHIAAHRSSEAQLLARVVLKEHDQLEKFRDLMADEKPSGHWFYGAPE